LASSPLQDPFGLAGTLLEGQYRVDDVVGEGGFGVVYRGWHLSLDQPVAIKVLKGLDGGDPAINALVLEKFRAEARLLYTLSQSSLHIVRALDFGASTTPVGVWAPFMVLEWLDGRSLESDLAERRREGVRGRPLGEALDLLRPVAEGLAVAHQRHVVHRDIKPANIFLLAPNSKTNPPGVQVKVLDFGIAKIMKEGEAAGTKGTFASFTWLYATPEQLDPRLGATGLETDVYALALVVTEVLTGLPPVRERDVVGIMRVAMDPRRRPTPRTLGANIPDAVEAVCAKALAVDPKGRYGSIGELWSALSAAHGGGPTLTTLQVAVAPPSAVGRPSLVTPPSAVGRPSFVASTSTVSVPMSTAQPTPASPRAFSPNAPPPIATPPPFVLPPGLLPPPVAMPPQGPPPGTRPPVVMPMHHYASATPPPAQWPRRLPFVRPDGSNTVVALTVTGFILAMLFAGSCAVIRAVM
jgi:serine/threonine-protein kinase